ncbi:MAG: glycosyltransferase, partial [Nitrospinota bacterium]|nr:glycosyltransferase [Nitrospinota bacterium]
MDRSSSALPPITIGIINFNGQEVIANTISSALRSGYGGGMEIIVVDDRSTDSSPEMVRRDFPQARLFIQEKNMGPNAARNRALAEAANEIVFITDNDIELAPDCLALLVERL